MLKISGYFPHSSWCLQSTHWWGDRDAHGHPAFWQQAQVKDPGSSTHIHPVRVAVKWSISKRYNHTNELYKDFKILLKHIHIVD